MLNYSKLNVFPQSIGIKITCHLFLVRNYLRHFGSIFVKHHNYLATRSENSNNFICALSHNFL